MKPEIQVLIVEDDPMVAEFNRRYVGKIPGFSIKGTCGTVQQAMAHIQDHEVDLVLLDLYMPGDHGLEFLTHIRKLERDIDVIVISAASDMKTVQKALRLGAVDYMIKPFEFERLKKSLTKYRDDRLFIKRQEAINQEDLDKGLLYRDSTADSLPMPKGLTKTTLKVIWDHVLQNTNIEFTSEEFAQQIGISRVSIRKYLHFLKDVGILEHELHYGTIGRPYSVFRLDETRKERIHNYL
ncbi:response regulator [Ammoniphilus sp. YIM 78166]|uniref:response regulator n=1 Tax=Ammoniphilus sp. YIM 78166 TaxID=1644106 RepID=UPI00106F42BC|nr:response regulator [Ammoniphilus sp. YIM 78166]